MNTRYCANSGCGKATAYTAIKPTHCPHCDKPFAAAFASVTPQPTPSAHTPTYTPAAPAHVFRDAKGNDISHRYAHPASTRQQVSETDDDYYDRDAAAWEAQQLAASIKGSIKIGANIDSDNAPVRLGDLPNIQKAVADAGQAGSKGGRKRARK